MRWLRGDSGSYLKVTFPGSVWKFYSLHEALHCIGVPPLFLFLNEGINKALPALTHPMQEKATTDTDVPEGLFNCDGVHCELLGNAGNSSQPWDLSAKLAEATKRDGYVDHFLHRVWYGLVQTKSWCVHMCFFLG